MREDRRFICRQTPPSWSFSTCPSKTKKEDFKERGNILEKALEAEDKHRKDIDAIMQIDERKRPYSSLQEVKAATEEELEAFRMKRGRSDDPMSSFLAKLPPPLPADSPKLSPWD
ncbi:unnamed protein product [Pleuronectes platessa]|uniref:Uncharacterized protein n=1 Tax=Pleuronectes platessa TaxID=8262 RepID=A0A9N7ZBZ4_PLEPL|nr:unnamed protein product [Pleuronectes platessa]